MQWTMTRHKKSSIPLLLHLPSKPQIPPPRPLPTSPLEGILRLSSELFVLQSQFSQTLSSSNLPTNPPTTPWRPPPLPTTPRGDGRPLHAARLYVLRVLFTATSAYGGGEGGGGCVKEKLIEGVRGGGGMLG